MQDINLAMFLNWNGSNDTNPTYLAKLIVEILNNNNDEHLGQLRQAIIDAEQTTTDDLSETDLATQANELAEALSSDVIGADVLFDPLTSSEQTRLDQANKTLDAVHNFLSQLAQGKKA